MTPTAKLGDYIKRAFLYRWNLLAFGGGIAAAVLSPWPDAILALVAAGELIYLTQLVSNSRFRTAVDAEIHKQTKDTAVASSQQTIQQLLAGVTFESRRRFEQLRNRCLEMRAIAQGVRGSASDQPGEDLSTSALDKLLWVFLRLLYSQEALNQFLRRTDIKDITTKLEEAKLRLASTQPEDRIHRSLSDNVAAQEMRLANYEKAQKNAEFVRIELDRIEVKIQALTEVAVNRQDPDFLTGQIDSVSASMQTTESAIRELQSITGLVDEMQEPPAILESDLGKVAQ